MLDIPIEDEAEDLCDLCDLVNKELTDWYCNDAKYKLSNILDAYAVRGQMITNYVTCVNLLNIHWIVLRVNIINNL